MPLPRVAVPHGPFGPADLRAMKVAARDGCEPVLLFRAHTADAERDLIGTAARVFEAHVVAREELAGVAAAHRLDGVAFLHDRGLEYAEAIAAAAGFPTGAFGAATWDKLTQRRLLHEAGLSAARCLPVDSAAEFAAAAARLGPGVLKPRRGDSSVGICLVPGPEQAHTLAATQRDWANHMFESLLPAGAHPANAGLGDFVSVECVSGERHRPVGVFDKLPAFRAAQRPVLGAVMESGHVFPSSLPAPMLRRLLDFVTACLDTIGVRNHVTHTEVRIIGEEFEVIEVNGRPGGTITPMLAEHCGIDLVAAAFGLALGRPVDSLVPDGIGVPAAFIARVLPTFADDAELVASDADIRELRAAPGVDHMSGVARRGRPRSLTEHRAAMVQVRAGSLPELLRNVAEVHRRFAAEFAADTLLGH